MSTASTARRLLATAGVCALAVTGAAMTTAAAGADPGQPGIGCEPQDFAYVCDGPVHPDQTFERCRVTNAILGARGLYLPRTEKCWIVDLADNPVFGIGQPQHHIEP